MEYINLNPSLLDRKIKKLNIKYENLQSLAGFIEAFCLIKTAHIITDPSFDNLSLLLAYAGLYFITNESSKIAKEDIRILTKRK